MGAKRSEVMSKAKGGKDKWDRGVSTGILVPSFLSKINMMPTFHE